MVELLLDLAKSVQQNEPGVSVYRITRGSVSDDGSQDIRVIEQYVSHTLTVLIPPNRCVVLFSHLVSLHIYQAGEDGEGKMLID